MNSTLKYILIGLNLVMLIVAIIWYLENPQEKEPVIIAIGQLATILALFLRIRHRKFSQKI